MAILVASQPSRILRLRQNLDLGINSNATTRIYNVGPNQSCTFWNMTLALGNITHANRVLKNSEYYSAVASLTVNGKEIDELKLATHMPSLLLAGNRRIAVLLACKSNSYSLSFSIATDDGTALTNGGAGSYKGLRVSSGKPAQVTVSGRSLSVFCWSIGAKSLYFSVADPLACNEIASLHRPPDSRSLFLMLAREGMAIPLLVKKGAKVQTTIDGISYSFKYINLPAQLPVSPTAKLKVAKI